MSDANLDLQPASDRFRKRLERLKQNPQEYAAEREKRVGDQVEKVTEDQERNKVASEILFFVEAHEEELKKKLGGDLEKATGALQNYDARQWDDMTQLFKQGKFDLAVDSTEKGEPQISVRIDLPEGNVQEKIPLSLSKQQEIIASMHAKNEGRSEKKLPKRKAA